MHIYIYIYIYTHEHFFTTSLFFAVTVVDAGGYLCYDWGMYTFTTYSISLMVQGNDRYFETNNYSRV